MWTAIELSTNRRPGNQLRSQISIERLEDRVTPSASGWGDFQQNLAELYVSAFAGDEVATVDAFNALMSDYVDFFEFSAEVKSQSASSIYGPILQIGHPASFVNTPGYQQATQQVEIAKRAIDLINFEMYSDIIEAGTGALTLLNAYKTLDPVLASQGVNLLQSGFFSGYVHYGRLGLEASWATQSQNYSDSDDLAEDNLSDESLSDSVDDLGNDLLDDTKDQIDDSSDD
jgi:hypothetical protein